MTTNFKFAQVQPFALSGSGAITGATSITLKSFQTIDGTNLAMTDFGTVGFGTIDPGNGTLEEQISFTGVVQNSNGTATLTGVSSVTFLSPYTATSGLSKTHAGSTTFVISNTSGFYNELVAKNDDATITGKYTFPGGGDANAPVSGTVYAAPTADLEYASKKYVDNVVVAGAPNANSTTKGIVQLPTQSQVDAGTDTGSTGASLTPTPSQLRSKLLSDYVADTGAADAYVITPSPAISAYTAGQIFSFKAAHTNTTTSTLNVNALGTKTIKKLDGATNLTAGNIVAGQIVIVEYDGTNFQMINPSANVVPSIGSGQINEFLTTTDGVALSFGRPFDYQSFTASGTWNKPTNLSGNEIVIVQAWGAGGGGGGNNGTSNSAGAGGGGGTFIESRFLASALGSTETVTIGAGGTAGTTTTNGGVGGTTTFGSHLSAFGGGGGGKGTSGTGSGGGGGGGGMLSAGSTGTTGSASDVAGATGGNPIGGTGVSAAAGNSPAGFGGAGGGGFSNGTGIGAAGGAAYSTGGGGGGAGNSAAAGAGGASFFGGGGGGGGSRGSTGGSGGVSTNGGSGGAGGSSAAGSDGSAPGGGGGGAGANSAGGGGARGEVRVWVLL